VNLVRVFLVGEFTISNVGSKTVFIVTSAAHDHFIIPFGSLMREEKPLQERGIGISLVSEYELLRGKDVFTY
jgi:hypothetical protein